MNPTEKYIKVKAIVTDKGDPSVGIYECGWVVECPFYKDEDVEVKEFFRQSLIKLYSEFADGRVLVDFDYEMEDLQKKINYEDLI